ncbi:MAG: hypothetical protein JWM04_2296 [Verrucomicrobiales bacterium]|nr:hypothetical protein [Verrucomicrobiales bacterium]
MRFGPALKAFLLCLFIGGSGIGYVWNVNQIHTLGRMKKQKEARMEELRALNKRNSDYLATLLLPSTLEARMKKLNVNLIQPPLAQIVRLQETPTPGGLETAKGGEVARY